MAGVDRGLKPGAAEARFAIVGGASGVGKTSLLESLSGWAMVSTGSHFKSVMHLQSRDDVRTRNWVEFEDEVCESVSREIVELLTDGRRVVLDTHFAAKVIDFRYRIGMRRELLYRLGRAVLNAVHDSTEQPAQASVVLVCSEASELLDRRRRDSTRNRESVPSDCVISLRQNEICSRQYYAELERASQSLGSVQLAVAYHCIANSTFETAVAEMQRVLRSGEGKR